MNMFNSIKFGNTAVKYQAAMYMLETNQDDNEKRFAHYNEYIKGQAIKFKTEIPKSVTFLRYNPKEKRIYFEHNEDICYCSEEEFHKWVGRDNTSYTIGIPDPVMIDTKTGMPYTNISTDYMFLYKFEGYEWDNFRFIHADFSKENEITVLMQTENNPYGNKILKFTKTDRGNYIINNSPTLQLRDYHKR